MLITNLISVQITQVYEGDNWTDANIADTIKDLNWQQAQQHTPGSPNTIASLLHHLCYWNGILMQRIEDVDPEVPEINGYDVDELKDENDWSELKEKTRQSFIQLANRVKKFPEEKLGETYATGKSSYYKNFQGIVEHAYYHLGQIIILKNLLEKH